MDSALGVLQAPKASVRASTEIAESESFMPLPITGIKIK
jgi:hypothetical protein